MFDVIEVSVLSIVCNSLLYLNLPLNLFTSLDSEYLVRDVNIFDFNDWEVETLLSS